MRLNNEGQVKRLTDKEKSEILEAEFTRLYTELRMSVYKFCLAKLPSDSRSAEDCVQNAFIVLYRKMLDGCEIEYPKAFLYKTANNYIMRVLRDKKRAETSTVSLEDYEGVYDGAYEHIENEVDYKLLEERLSAYLSEKEEELLRLRFTEQRSLEEISEALGLTPSATAKRVLRLRQKLVKYINNEERSGGIGAE